MGIIKLATKTAIVGGSVYLSKDLGVWGDSKQATDLYNCISKQADPHLKELKSKVPVELPYLPSSGEVCYLTKHYYNQGVKNTFNFVHMMPCYLGRWTKKGIDAVKGALDQPAATATTPAAAPVSKKSEK